MNNSKRFNIVGWLLVVALLIVAGLALHSRLSSADAKRSSPTSSDCGDYTSTLVLGGTVLEGEVYHFAGDAIRLRMILHCEGGRGVSDDLAIELHRVEAVLIDVLVDSQVVPREGSVVADWEDLPEGDYYFVFKKAADNQILVSNRVVMQGYQMTNEQVEGL